MKKVFLFVLPLLLLLAAAGHYLYPRPQEPSLPSPLPRESARQIGNAFITQTNAKLRTLKREERCYVLENGDTVAFGRASAEDAVCRADVIHSNRLDCAQAVVWYYDLEQEEWVRTAIEDMIVDSTCVYIDGANCDYFYYLPIGYLPIENNSLRETGLRGLLSITQEGDGWLLSLQSPRLGKGEVCDYTVVQGEGEIPLLDFAQSSLRERWKSYCHTQKSRWCYDGFYYEAPATYQPTDCFYRCVATYFGKGLCDQVDTVRCARDLSLALLDTTARFQNEKGYFPSMSLSEWLKEDYGIDENYYDTRFNSDLMLIYYNQISRFGGFQEVYENYFKFYLDYAKRHHYLTRQGGYLVWDYSNSTSSVHTSLNHQLAQMLVLYRYGTLLNREDLIELADKMLLGVEDTCTDWITETGDLWYCYFADGTYGRGDYPYLTYNDLLFLQREFASMGREPNEALQTLMDSKKEWMDRNGVTAYEK